MTRRFPCVFGVVACLALNVGCGPATSSAGDPATGADYRPTSTIKDIMDSVIDPSADFVWDSVQVLSTVNGIEERAPKTDDDWKAVRRHAVSIVEASNLIIMPGRRIARPGEKADDPKVDLSPEAIQALVDADRAGWVRLAHGLHDAASQTLAAVDSRDVKALLAAGEVLDAACESCHKRYWYPKAPTDPASGGASGEAEKR